MAKRKAVKGRRRRALTEAQMIRREAKYLRQISRITNSERIKRLDWLRLTESERLVGLKVGD